MLAAPAATQGMVAGSAGRAETLPVKIAPGAPGETSPGIPYPPGNRPVTVEYSINGQLPSWDSSGDVLQVSRNLPDAQTAGAFAHNAGLPSQALDSKASITSVSLQWKDSDDFQWSFDAAGRYASFWKNVAYPEKTTEQPGKQNYDKNEIIAVADRFLDAHGFSAIRAGGGEIEDQQWIGIMQGKPSDSAIYPCPLEGGTSGGGVMAPQAKSATVSSPGVSVGAGIAAQPGIIVRPIPCGWWPQQVTVFYGGTREGKPVVDASGNAYRPNSVTVDISSKQVMSGNLQLEENVERASYPLIDADTARKRLQSGGLNPVWPWGSETKTIKVSLDKLDVVWMRYDAWQENGNQTYYLPALRAKGTVNRGIKGQQPEDYVMLVPLVADGAFEDQTVTPPPVIEPMPAVQDGVRAESAPAANAPAKAAGH